MRKHSPLFWCLFYVLPLTLSLAGTLWVVASAGGWRTVRPIPRSLGMRKFWQRQQQSVNQEPGRVFAQLAHGFDPKTYPSESALSFLSAWRVTGERAYLETAKRQLAFAHSLENTDHLLPAHQGRPMVARVSQARLVLGYYLAYRALKDKRYLHWADDALEAMLNLQRTQIEWKGQTFTIYYHVYATQPPYRPMQETFLNPNQDAVVGLITTLLYHTPESRHACRPLLRRIALENLDAAIALQTPDGRLPEAQTEPDHFDTRYGHHTLLSVFWANLFWKEARYDGALRRSLPWLLHYTRAGSTLRYAPYFYSGPMREPTELWYRLPILYYYHQDLTPLQRTLDTLWSRTEDFSDIPGGFVAPVVALELMGVPREAGRW